MSTESTPDPDRAEACRHRLVTLDRFIRWNRNGWETVSTRLTASIVQSHLDGKAVIGSYPAHDGIARFGVIDVDLHLDDREPTAEEVARVEQYAIRKSQDLRNRSIEALLVRGHAFGSFHLIFFVAPILAARLGRWLRSFVADANGIQVDTYPSVTGEGNAVRLPGRHHKKPESWSEAWTGDGWGAWPLAIDLWLTLGINPTNYFPDPGSPRSSELEKPRATRPGDVFDLLVPVEDVLVARGWKVEREEGDRVRFTRPGKRAGVSASVRGSTVWVFTSSVKGLPASSEGGRPYTAFQLIAFLDFGGDFPAAARALARAGFCRQPASPPPPTQRYIQLPDWKPFPVHCLPGPWAEFVRQGADALHCDPAYVALPLISVLAGAIGNTRRVFIGGEWFEPSVWWSCIIGVSGTQKSPAAELSINLVNARQKKLMVDYRQALKQYKQDLAAWKEVNRGQPADAEGRPERPVPKRVLVSDITIEKLTGLLGENPRGLLSYRDELAGWIGSFQRYKGKAGGTDEPNWLSVHGAKAIIYDRKTGEKTTVYVPYAAVSMTGGIQPKTLARLLGQDSFDSGLVARVVVAFPPRVPKRWSDGRIEDAVKLAAEQNLDALYALVADVDEEGDPRPVIVKLSPEARTRFRAFVNEWGQMQFQADDEPAAALAKLEGMAARYALIHHVATHAGQAADTDPIGIKSVEAGIEVVHWAAREMERVYQMLRESDDERKIRALVELVRRHGGRITPFELKRSNRSRYLTSGDAEAALEVLVSAGIGHWEESLPDSKGGRPTTAFVLSVPIPETAETSFHNGLELEDKTFRISGGNLPSLPRADSGASNQIVPTVDGERRSSWTSESDAEVSAVSGTGTEESKGDEEPAEFFESASSEVEGFRTNMPEGLRHSLLTGTAHLGWLVAAIEDSPGLIGIDTETTGLDPVRDRVRLLQIATERDVVLIDLFSLPDPRTDLAPLFEVLAERELIGHNLGFDLLFLRGLGFEPGAVFDTLLASKLLHSGERGENNAWLRHGLEDVVERELGQKLDKSQRQADWSGSLTPAMLAYAAEDARVLLPLAEDLKTKLAAAGLDRIAATEMRAVPGIAWCGPIAIDSQAWADLADAAETEQIRLREQMDVLAPNSACLPGAESWNWNSPEDVKLAFQELGITLESTDDDTLAGIDHPLAANLRQYRGAAKLSGTYGRKWLDNHLGSDARVLASWNQLGAESGRMSCSDPNLQQIPREQGYRKCFVAGRGNLLVKADYSQIELRIAAKVANEPVMIRSYRERRDLHTLTAARLLNKSESEVSKPDRQLAKAVNFGLLYGMGWRVLKGYALTSYGVVLSDADAKRYRDTFFRTYPALKSWHQRTAKNLDRLVQANPRAMYEVRTLGGRRHSMSAAFQREDGAVRTNVTNALNAPVQGTGADGLKTAIALLWESRSECPTARPVIYCHDEIVLEVPEADAERAAEWLRRRMVDAVTDMIDPVPVEVEISIGMTWGG